MKPSILLRALLLAGFLLGAADLRADGDNVAVLAKSEGALAEAGLTAKDIKDIYLGNKTYVGKTKVMVVFCTKDEVAAVFLDKVLGSSAGAYKKAWAEKTFQGGTAPTEVAEPEDGVALARKSGSVLTFVPAEFLFDKKNILGTKVILLTK